MANFLDVDESLVARSLLLFPNNSSEQGTDVVLPGSSNGAGSLLRNGPQILTPSARQEQSQCKFIIPQPGLCIKTREVITNQKVFVNLCKSDDVPEPDEYFTDDQLGNLLSSDVDEDIKSVRLPMSLGDKHIEKDKAGSVCPVFDVVINTKFFELKILTSEMYRTFLIVCTIEGLEEKFQMELDKNNYVILQHKKAIGKLTPQLVKSRPGIKELKPQKESSDVSSSASIKKPLVEEIDTKELQLDCKISQISSELAVVKIKLPNLKNTKKLSVTLGADRIIVESPVGSLDVFVPLDIHQEQSKAEFDLSSSTLSLHLPLVIKP